MKAFPQKYPQDPARPWSHLANPVDCGMDLRDYFAGQVISAFTATHGYATAAKFAYQLADEMMKARNDS